MVLIAFATVAILLICILARIYSILPRSTKTRHSHHSRDSCRLAVFLGSGGHTSEALSLLSSLDFSRYSPRTYICSAGDLLSAKKAVAVEAAKAAESPSHPTQETRLNKPYSIITIPRARRVHQSLLTTPLSAARSLAVCLYYVMLLPLISGEPFADVVLLNGPGTCCIVCLAIYFSRFFGLPSPKIIYVESFARVRSLSLTGKLLRLFVDRFIVQWPDLLRDQGRGECRGWLV
ncbi:glycosyltransferase family 1 protein [Cristinia sonorae]|uniref:UDP-N-acetylglucosamine transferase subunit ALG14 n=1 Tax=Cristinia sonorae TaxID=1940300 RepID=A0A8K0UE96_9AGAR|nr:glycosyltransferase family 1 protein [Cristinia sonorae]